MRHVNPRRVLLVLGLVGISWRAEAQTRDFFCGEDSTLTVTVINPTTVTAGLIEGETLTMTQIPGNPLGFFYGDYQILISPDQTRVQLMVPDFGAIDCIHQGGGGSTGVAPAPAPPPQMGGSFPIPAKSWGGSVRSGPGVEYQQVGSLGEGQPIVIIEQSSAPFYQDRPWFKISYGGRTGYHWGGIICPLGAPVPGTYQVCN